jgi:hypothetical protein
MFIKIRIEDKKYVLYTVNNYTQIYFVFILFNNKHKSLIKYLKAITTYVFR